MKTPKAQQTPKKKKKPVPFKPKFKTVPLPELNKRENKLFWTFADGKPHPIQQLKQLFYKEALYLMQEDHKAEHELRKQSIVRNGLRRLRDDFEAEGRSPGLGYVTKVDRGVYQITQKGQRRLKALTGMGARERQQLMRDTSPVVVKGKKLTKKR